MDSVAGLRLSREGAVAIVTLDRPDKRNAISLAMWSGLPDLFAGIATESNIRGIVLTGAGGNFSAGADIGEFAAVRASPAQGKAYEVAVDTGCDAIVSCPKPVVAAIAGFCIGGACNLAMACDFRFMAPDARWSIPAARLSIVYGIRGTARLHALVGLTEAKRIMFTGARYDAAHALGCGFADEVAADPVPRAVEFIGAMADNAPLSIAGAKYLLNGIADPAGGPDPARAAAVIAQAVASRDYEEGRQAFVEKRRPMFQGH